MKWYVKYTVAGFGEQKAGPYEYEEAREQQRDIEGYTGVTHVHLEGAPEDESREQCNDCGAEVLGHHACQGVPL